MKTLRNEIVIAAPPSRVYAQASATERWPDFLPHYRYVRLLQSTADRRVLEMAARRGAIPVRWRAEQRNDPEHNAMYFTHLSGWTRGMEVAWRFFPANGGTRVSVDHLFPPRYALPEPIARYVVGAFFIDHIATQTLRCLKLRCECER